MPRTRSTDFDITDERLPWEMSDHSWQDESPAPSPADGLPDETPAADDAWATRPPIPSEDFDVEELDSYHAPDRLLYDWDPEPDTGEAPPTGRIRPRRLRRSHLILGASVPLAAIIGALALTGTHRSPAGAAHDVSSAGRHETAQRAVILNTSSGAGAAHAPRAGRARRSTTRHAGPRPHTQRMTSHRPAHEHPATSASSPQPASPIRTPGHAPAATPATTSSNTTPVTTAAPTPPVSVAARAPAPRSSRPSEFSFER
jgi:hypothetical protein